MNIDDLLRDNESAILDDTWRAVAPAQGLGLVGAALVHDKDTLARTFVSYASCANAPAIELTELAALFNGTDCLL